MLHKVLLVDDHPLFRVGLRQILEESSNIVVIAEVDTPERLYNVSLIMRLILLSQIYLSKTTVVYP